MEQPIYLSFMLSLNGESGILFIMKAIMNYDTLLYIPALYSGYQQILSFRHRGKEMAT